ncbi:MAG: alpha/beta hydrolase [Rhodospirillaceae bacterium]|nr:alpha/beta hydrolase [Rhodospirillaceae bacterium]
MTAIPQFIDVDGVKLECLHVDAGASPEKPTLVFLHEGLGCVALWRNFPEQLCQTAGLNGFVYSRQGYGASDPIPLPRPVEYMHHEGLNVVSPVLEAAGITSAILIGHSNGGSIAVIHAGAVKDPKVKAIMLMATHVLNEESVVSSIREAKIAYDTSNLRQGLAKYHGDNVDCAFRGWNDVWLHPDFWHWNIEEFLPGIEIPTLVMQGVDDQYGSAAQVKAIEAGLNCPTETILIEGARHSPHLDQPAATIKAMINFIKQQGIS